jgi:endonuclease/exonuclease/phosphatase family metal-dependent hydrolase
MRLCENSLDHGLTRIFTDFKNKPNLSFWKLVRSAEPSSRFRPELTTKPELVEGNLFKKQHLSLTQKRFPSSRLRTGLLNDINSLIALLGEHLGFSHGFLIPGLLTISLAIHTFSFAASSQTTRITVDGVFSDWDDRSPAYEDAIGDHQGGSLDFGRIWLANDDRYLFIRIEVGAEINIQDLNPIRMYLDTDNQSTTGQQISGMGAELVWHFGARFGQFSHGSNTTNIIHSNIGLVTAPTVSSTQFEIALDREARPTPGTPLFTSEIIRLQFVDGQGQSDLLPDQPLSYTLDPGPFPALPSVPIAKQNQNHLRVLSYNVELDGLFVLERRNAYERILGAIQPEIIGFEEIIDNTAELTAQVVESMLPSPAGEQWYAAKVDPDIVAVSRFPILSVHAVFGNGAFLIDLRPKYDSDLLFIIAHPPCCNNDEARQFEIDAIMAFIRDAKNPGGALGLKPNAPIVIVGDMNLVGFAQQLETLLTGDIQNSAQFGQPFSPDWDGSNFADLHPRQIQAPFSFTWFRASNSFHPGRLDYIIFSDSVLEPENEFVLFTPSMSQNSLEDNDLEREDAIVASDHLPVVADFTVKLTSNVGTAEGNPQPRSFELKQNYPNPSRSETTIEFILEERAQVDLSIYNVRGQLVRKLRNGELGKGRYEVRWDGKDDQNNPVANGQYFYQLKVGGLVVQRKLILMN